MKLKKKGFGVVVIISLILAILIAVLLIIYLGRFKELTVGLKDYEICKQSVFANANLKLNVGGSVLKEGEKINCKTTYKVIDKFDEKKLKKQIADSMAYCWDMFGQGKLEVFDTETENYCVVCSVFEFEKDAKDKNINNFFSYLHDNKNVFKGKTYFEFLTGVKMNDENIELINPEYLKMIKISTSEPLSVMFTMEKQAYTGKPESAIWSAAAGGALGLVGGALIIGGFTAPAGLAVIGLGVGGLTGWMLGSDHSSDWEARVLLWPYNDLKSLNCTRLEGKSRLEEQI